MGRAALSLLRNEIGARKEDILGRTKTRCGKNMSETRLRPWQKRWNAWTMAFSAGFWSVVCCCQSGWLQWPAVLWARRFGKRCGNVPGKYGPHSELFFFLIKKEPVALAKAVPFNPFVSAETLKACALFGLHLLAAEGENWSSGCRSPDSGDMWRYGCPTGPDWDGDGESWSESEVFSSSDFREHSVESLALNVIGQNVQAKSCPFSWRIGNLRGWPWAATLPWICCARKCTRPGSCQRGPLSQEGKPLSHRGRAVTVKERSVVERILATS